MKRLISLTLTLVLCATLATPALAMGENIGQIVSVKYGVEIEANLELSNEPDNALTASLITASSSPQFSDVPDNHNFYNAIMDCSGRGIVGGYGDGTFKPSNTVSRSNFVVMLSRAFYADQVAANKNFEDIGKFLSYYWTLFQAGVLEGTSFSNEADLYGTETMGQPITRYDMAQLMTNIMKNQGFAASETEKTQAATQITDYNAIPSQYQDAVANVYALGVIGGYADGSFSGEITMNRGQAAVVIFRMMQYAPAVPGGVGPTPVDPTPVAPTPVEPEIPETPEVPETPVETPVTGKTLANGKAITVENVSEILADLKARYPNKTSFANGYAGLNSGRNPYTNCIYQITNQYWRAENHSQHTGTDGGCGGWAAFVADEIFGQTGVTWKKTTLDNIRPGDLLIKLDDAGYLMHVGICTGRAPGFEPTMKIQTTNAAGSPYVIGWGNTVTLGYNYDVYTAYPD